MIEFPSTLRPRDVTVSYVDFGGLTTPVFGGEILRTNRPGNRFRLSVDMPPIRASQHSGILSDLIRGKQEGLRIRWEQGFDVRNLGTPVIDGDDQQGTSLDLSGFTPGLTLEKDMFFSFEQGGKSRLHMLTAAAVVDSAGDVTVTIEPELRVLTVDGSTCEFSEPVIDGFVEGDEWSWKLSVAHNLEISFELLERY